jgi:hypothetical protein
VGREEVSSDTRKLRFALPGAERGVQLGLPVGMHVLLGTYIDDQLVVRPYTPIAPVAADEDPGMYCHPRTPTHWHCLFAIVRLFVAKRRLPNNAGYVEFLIKIYFSNKSKAFPAVHFLLLSLEIAHRLSYHGTFATTLLTTHAT